MLFNEFLALHKGTVIKYTKMIARKNRVHDLDLLDDMLQAAFISISQSLPSYEPTKGCRSAWAFVKRNATREIYGAINIGNGQARYPRYEPPVLVRDTEDPMFHPTMEQRILIRQLFKRLNKQQKRLIKLHYFQDMDMGDVAKKLKLNRTWVHRLHNRALITLRGTE